MLQKQTPNRQSASLSPPACARAREATTAHQRRGQAGQTCFRKGHASGRWRAGLWSLSPSFSAGGYCWTLSAAAMELHQPKSQVRARGPTEMMAAPSPRVLGAVLGSKEADGAHCQQGATALVTNLDAVGARVEDRLARSRERLGRFRRLFRSPGAHRAPGQGRTKSWAMRWTGPSERVGVTAWPEYQGWPK